MTSDSEFGAQLAEQAPTVRAFARTLARDVARADDLAQETLLKAWANREKFEPGSNLRAWLFTILRNSFYSSYRKSRREVADPEGEYQAKMATKPSQDDAMAMRDFEHALSQLPDEQREALVLIAVAGLSYEEACEVVNAPVGTVKSRVNRARARLAELLGVETGADMVTDHVMDASMGGSITRSVA